MLTRLAQAEWKGGLKDGAGKVKVTGFEGPYSFVSRFESGPGTNPEELLGAAHAGCFTMALTAQLTAAGHPPAHVHTTAKVGIEKGADGWKVESIELVTEAQVSGIEDAKFQELAKKAKETCPMSRALAAVPSIHLQAKLIAG